MESFQFSPQQERAWAIEPDGPTARTQLVLAIDGHVDADAVIDALRASVRRHESLRTTVAYQPGLTFPLQVVNPQLEPSIETIKVSSDLAERKRRLEQVIAAELRTAFDLEKGPLLRAALLMDGERATALVLTVSALCADLQSLSLLTGELADQLAGRQLTQDPLQYADFSAWQHELEDSQEDEARTARGFWQASSPAISPALPFTRARGGECEPELLAVQTDDSLGQVLAELASRYGTSAGAFVQAAWHAVLGRFAATDTTTVAFVPGSRRHADLDGAIGAFARPVPVSALVDGSRAFAEVLAELAAERTQALVRQDYAPASGLESLEVGFVEYPLTLAGPDGVHLSIDRATASSGTLPLLAMCGVDAGRISVSIAFDAARYDRDVVDALGHALGCMVRAAAADPSVSLVDVDVVDEQERERVLRTFNDLAVPAPGERVHELFARYAQSSPERIAVVDADGSISYGELEARANQLAHRLRESGAGPQAAVGLCTDRSMDTVVGLLGALKAGAAYVPLHHEHPPARLAHQLRQAGARVLVTQAGLLDRVAQFDGEAICLDRDRAELDGRPTQAPSATGSHEDLAYVIYTSGSTGTPKGVEVTHGNLANYANYIVSRLGADHEPLSFALATSISTDLGNTSVFGALCSGGTLVLIDPAAVADPAAMAQTMRANDVDVLKITPSHIGALLTANDPGVLPRRWLVVGGELASWDLIERVRSLSDCAILNHYGPTETTIGCCTHPVGEDPGEYRPAGVPIGRAIANTSCYVLDERRRPVPIGVTGRLFVSGAGVARGYAAEQQMTDERFSADPFADGARMYDTGDLTRWLPDGSLEFMGRVDEQLKLRGYRVEPAEIETALRSHPQVREAVTVIQAGPGDEPRLLAYCSVANALGQEQLRSHLADWLPEFMIPSAIVVLDELPRTPSGKVDKQALPDPDLAAQQDVAYLAPRTPIEEAVAKIWEQVLGVSRVGAEDDFFALGGHSLLATQVVARVRSDFAVDLPLHSLFTYPTVASLAAEMVNLMGASEGDETDRLMAELAEMSDEEAERLLAHDLSADTGRP